MVSARRPRGPGRGAELHVTADGAGALTQEETGRRRGPTPSPEELGRGAPPSFFSACGGTPGRARPPPCFALSRKGAPPTSCPSSLPSWAPAAARPGGHSAGGGDRGPPSGPRDQRHPRSSALSVGQAPPHFAFAESGSRTDRASPVRRQGRSSSRHTQPLPTCDFPLWLAGCWPGQTVTRVARRLPARPGRARGVPGPRRLGSRLPAGRFRLCSVAPT